VSGEYLIRWFAFSAMSLVVGIFASFSTPAAVAAAVGVFGYGVSEICEAIRATHTPSSVLSGDDK
jgi:hypothetical protein